MIAPVTPFQQNCTIVWCQRTMKAAVIDPGGEVERLLKAVAERGLELEKIWITHGHADHAGGADAVREASGAPIEGPHSDDLFWIEQIPDAVETWGLADARAFTPDRWLGEGDEVQVGEARFEVRHCPGHTPGHVIFFNRQARFPGGRRFVQGIDWAHGLSPRKSRPADRRDHAQALAPGRRRALRARARTDVEFRRGTGHQHLCRGPSPARLRFQSLTNVFIRVASLKFGGDPGLYISSDGC